MCIIEYNVGIIRIEVIILDLKIFKLVFGSLDFFNLVVYYYFINVGILVII